MATVMMVAPFLCQKFFLPAESGTRFAQTGFDFRPLFVPLIFLDLCLSPQMTCIAIRLSQKQPKLWAGRPFLRSMIFKGLFLLSHNVSKSGRFCQ
jgi:hypothetical protein